MRIALCLSGGPRFKHRAIFRLVESFTGYDQADFFIRTWKSPAFGGTPEAFVKYLKDNGMSAKCNYPVVQVLDDAPPNHPPHIPLFVAPWAPNFLTMWWGIVQTNELRRQYEKETGTKYDLVFRVRTDVASVAESANEKIHLPDYLTKAQTAMINARNFADTFLFGSPEMYEKFVGYWNYLSVLSIRQRTGQMRTIVHPEESLMQYFKEHNIPYELLPFDIAPWHDRDEYHVRDF